MSKENAKKDGFASMLKLGLILAAFAAVACVLLALVNNVTEPKIAQTKAMELKNGLSTIFTQATDFEEVPGFTKETINGVDIESMYIAKKDGQVIGCAVQATGATYDKSTILTGVTTDRKIQSIKFLSCSDTSGFGLNATKPEFYNQFAGKSIDDKFNAEKGGDIDGLSGATISRRGIAKILKVSTQKAQQALDSLEGSAE